jgi:hypothetical protein
MRQDREPRDEEDALGDLSGDLFEEDKESSSPRRSKVINWRRIIFAIGVLALTLFIILAINGVRKF